MNFMDLTSQPIVNQSGFCLNFTAQQLSTNTTVTLVLHSMATLFCLFAIIFIIFTGLYRKLSYRIILYLMVTDTLRSITLMLELVPIDYSEVGVEVREGWEGVCSAIGYISQMTETAKLTLIVWIVAHLLWLATFKFQLYRVRNEVFGLLFVFLVPLAKDWLPFAWNMYGLSGMWCWIKLINNNCEIYTLGLGLMFAIEYGPMILVSFFTIAAFAIILITLYKEKGEAQLSWRGVADNSALKSGLPLIALPLMYVVMFLFRSGHKIYFTVVILNRQSPFTSVWLAHTIVIGLTAMIIPMAFLCYPSVHKRLCRCCFSANHIPVSGAYQNSLSFRKRQTSSLGTSGETDPFVISKDNESQDSLVYKSILSSVVTSVRTNVN